MTLENELKKRMGERTQIEFAEEIGIGQSTLSEILAGKRMPGLSVAASAIVRRFPELSRFFMPDDIAEALENGRGLDND